MILDAAVAVLVEVGYAGATTLRIQEYAGVSRGRLLHHFRSRDDLLVAAVRHLTGARTEVLATDEAWSPDPTERLDRVVERLWEMYRQPFFWASMELWMAARANLRLRAALVPHERQITEDIRRKTDRLFGPALTARPTYVAVRELLFTSMRGAAMTYSFRDAQPEAERLLPVWKEMARRLLDG